MKKFNFKCLAIPTGKTMQTNIYAENAAEAARKLNGYGEGRLVALSCEEVPIENYFKEMEAAIGNSNH